VREAVFSIKVCVHLSCLQFWVLIHWAPFSCQNYDLPHPDSKCHISQLQGNCAPELNQSE
jgi:hypothetical protein